MSTLPMQHLRRSAPAHRPFWFGRVMLIAGALGAVVLLHSGAPWLWTRPAFHKEIINRYAAEYHFDPVWVMSIVRVESGFVPWAQSHRGALGLMQLLPKTARELAPEVGLDHFRDSDLKNPAVNLHLGIYYLSKLREKFPDDENSVLAAYNAGLGITQEWRRGKPALELEDIQYPETRRFVTQVQRTYQFLKFIQRGKRLFGFDSGK